QLPAVRGAPETGDGRPGARAPGKGEAPRAEQGVDPRVAGDRVLPDRPLRRGCRRVPGDAGALAGRRLRALRTRPLPREARARGGGEWSLQARTLPAAGLEAVRGPGDGAG